MGLDDLLHVRHTTVAYLDYIKFAAQRKVFVDELYEMCPKLYNLFLFSVSCCLRMPLYSILWAVFEFSIMDGCGFLWSNDNSEILLAVACGIFLMTVFE